MSPTIEEGKIIVDKSETQLDKFREAVRELGADDDEKRFEAKLKKLVKPALTDNSKSESMPPDGDES